MGLEVYHRKRKFELTPEPRGRLSLRKGNQYVFQKHAARRLHYDLRLELGGVMKSWAVTKGPSLVPGAKRLAVQVEDHPIDYNTFEGTIPKGAYGAGIVLIWDRGRWFPEGDPYQGLKEGRLAFRLEGEKLKGGLVPGPYARQAQTATVRATGHPTAIETHSTDVCFTPESGRPLTRMPCLLCAISGHCRIICSSRRRNPGHRRVSYRIPLERTRSFRVFGKS